jgi:hypothetical protein
MNTAASARRSRSAVGHNVRSLIGAGGGAQHLYDITRLPVHSRHVSSM